MVDPRGMPREVVDHLRSEIGRRYGINLFDQYSEREAAKLILLPEKRPSGSADTSTIKRKRRSNKIPFVACGDGSVAYLGLMLCDFLLFGKNSMFLWGVSAPLRSPQTPTEAAAPSP